MRRVIIESPYRGETERKTEANVAYARACLLDSLKRGEAPIASHLIYTQVLDDDDPEEREIGLKCGWAWLYAAEAVAIYTDRGISPGMKRGVNLALVVGLELEYRKIGWDE